MPRGTQKSTRSWLARPAGSVTSGRCAAWMRPGRATTATRKRAVRTDAVRDDDARRAAVDPGRSFIVQAPAGSGKTSLLTLRYLRLLATVSSPEEIVAITFTRKAASEMRHRIVRALSLAALPLEEGAQPHLRELHALARAALAHSRSRGWNLERNPSRLHVQTIDGLSHWLAQRLPLAARIALSATVVDDARPLYREAGWRLMAGLGAGEIGRAACR